MRPQARYARPTLLSIALLFMAQTSTALQFTHLSEVGTSFTTSALPADLFGAGTTIDVDRFEIAPGGRVVFESDGIPGQGGGSTVDLLEIVDFSMQSASPIFVRNASFGTEFWDVDISIDPGGTGFPGNVLTNSDPGFDPVFTLNTTVPLRMTFTQWGTGEVVTHDFLDPFEYFVQSGPFGSLPGLPFVAGLDEGSGVVEPYQFVSNNADILSMRAVPEPGTALLLGAGLGLVARARPRQRTP